MADVQAVTQQTIDDLVASGRETGIQVCAYLDGEPVVNVCSGTADPATGRLVEETTLFNSWSTGKGLASTVVHVLAEQGLLDYDTLIAEYWPRFAAHGKHGITLAHVLTHRAGVPQAPAGITLADLADWEGMCARIADLRPLWEPGTATGYHALTFGYIVGETVRRATGQSIAQVLHDRVGLPLHTADDLFFGVPADQLPRTARLQDGNWSTIVDSRPDDSPFFQAAPRTVQPGAALGNDPGYLTTDVPCAGTMTAAALARMYAALVGEVDGVRLVSPERTDRIAAILTTDADPVLGAPVPKGLGYFLGLPEMGPHPRAFGCKGSGGSIAYADPDDRFSFALTHNRMTAPPEDTAAHIAGQIRTALGIGP
ncbi:serine hydrolase domain-containing protein [Streptosporangium amethystogenes]|uniref:serine hydrolase domain-containing protein n=1 Tax=Streptosporangium amethystogenes TaxID=2002 RepID=UPI0037B69C14